MRDIDVLGVLTDPMFSTSFYEQWVMPYRGFAVDEFAKQRQLSAVEKFDLYERCINLTADKFCEILSGELGQ